MAALIEGLVEVVAWIGDCLPRALPERPRWLRWLVALIYVGVVAAVVALVILALT